MQSPTVLPRRKSVGKSEVGNVRFPLIALAVGNFPTVYPPLPFLENFPTKSSSVGKFPTVTDTVGNFPTVTKTVGNFPLLLVQWKIFYRTNVVANQGEIFLNH